MSELFGGGLTSPGNGSLFGVLRKDSQHTQ